MTITRRQALGAMGAMGLGAMLPRYAFAQDAETLVVPTLGGVWEQFWRDNIAPAFEKKTGAKVTLDVGNGRVFGANLRAAGIENPPYSIVMTNEVFAQGLRKEGYFEKLDLAKIPNYADLYPIAKTDDGAALVACYSPIGIGYRSDILAKKPTGWRDFWDNPDVKGQIGLYNFANSAGKMELLLFSKIFGKDQYDTDAGFAALKKLGSTIQVDINLSTALAQGEIVIAPFDFAEIARLKKQGLPVDYIIPEEGLIAFDQTMNICAHAPHKDLAYAYIDFLISPEIQEMMMKQFYISPTNSKVVVPDDLKEQVPVSGKEMDKILQWDWAFVNENQDKLSEQWAKEVG
ncbi:ABC transporter substrate-binding protein [Pseudooceanicola sp. CBS1P-1]|uniref:Extracellular solute-binding protein n=1 Tax=Pseudooceanicola albus TaxID=2692189 RepID=A0A6L7FYV7_9RHOB|nr:MULTISPECIES: ABC transporter substrate-binding protein [Pseudooceanicola]MBT9383966.1 ABC transporter substrate-binding protein [Pseudooceanicola endophyticus]MXN16622.1 extracellular solute-binding protein [Pseudooceanicola albus]